MMESDEIQSSLSGQLKALVEANKDFPQKLRQRLESESSKVENQMKFINELCNEGVLCEGSNDVVMLVQMAVTIGCSKGADGIGGMLRALESSGNSGLLSALQTWVKGDFKNETDDDVGPSEPEEGTSALQFPPSKRLRRNRTRPTELSSSGAKLMKKIKEHMDEDGFMEQLEAFLLSKASHILNAKEFRACLLHQDVPVENVVTSVPRQTTPSVPKLASGPQVQDGQEIERAIKVACYNKDTASLVLALQSSINEQIFVEILDWLESYQARNKNVPITNKIPTNEPMPTSTGLFAATSTGLISLDLRTLEATYLTSNVTNAVAVNNELKKVYWSEIRGNSCILRSNFDGSAQEVIVPQKGEHICTLAIDESSGNVYFVLNGSHEIKRCNALGKECAIVISNSPFVKSPVGIALDSENGFMYWCTSKSKTDSLARANLDGSNATTVSTGFRNLYGITLDQPANDVLYWVAQKANKIGSIDINGANKRVIVKLKGNPGPFGVQVDAHKIYFSNYYGKNIQSVYKHSGEELTTIFKATGRVHHLALFEAPVKQP